MMRARKIAKRTRKNPTIKANPIQKGRYLHRILAPFFAKREDEKSEKYEKKKKQKYF